MFRSLFVSLKLLALIWLVGFVIFYVIIPQKVDDQQTRVDAAVVLTGSPNRIETGFEVLTSDLTNTLFITGVNKTTNKEMLIQGHPVKNIKAVRRLYKRIHLGHSALDTISNAEETAEWARKNNVKTIRMITANYHMPRSVLIFSTMAPGLKVVPHPVFYNKSVQNGDALLTRLKLLMTEYMKYTVIAIMNIGAKKNDNN